MFGPNSVRISYTGDSRLLGTDGGQATEQLGLRILWLGSFSSTADPSHPLQAILIEFAKPP